MVHSLSADMFSTRQEGVGQSRLGEGWLLNMLTGRKLRRLPLQDLHTTLIPKSVGYYCSCKNAKVPKLKMPLHSGCGFDLRGVECGFGRNDL